jgi:DNA ligase-1
MSAAALLTSEIPADVSGWWVSEKYDGVRAIWNGRKLLSRNGKDLKAPKWFTDNLPKNLRLDGELWMGRGTFDTLVSVIQRKDANWQGVKFMVFDLADVGEFESRNRILQSASLPFHVVAVPHLPLASHAELDALERDIVNASGEGCVIRRPGSKYRPGRMGDTIKVKRLVEDCDRWQG